MKLQHKSWRYRALCESLAFTLSAPSSLQTGELILFLELLIMLGQSFRTKVKVPPNVTTLKECEICPRHLAETRGSGRL